MYNLLDKPFIRCFFEDGTQKELGLLEMFQKSKEIVRIGGDSEVQEVVLLRLLLAILYRATPEAEDSESWVELWENGISGDEICEYLESHRNRFDLLSPDTPFYQITGAEYNDKTGPSNEFFLLNHQLYNKLALYSPFQKEGIKELSFSLSARSLVELQSLNTGSIKKTIQGDPRQKKRTYAQPGWLANGSVVHLLGKNLEQTLLLNFIPYGELGIDYDDDLAVWEREPQTAAPEELHGDMDESRIPAGPADLFTHQPSRVTLYHNGENVTGAVVGIGDRLFKYNMHQAETMMAWREITRKTKETALVPVNQMADKDAWRAVNGLLASNAREKGQQIAPKTVEYSGKMKPYISTEFDDYIPTVVTTVFYGEYDGIINSESVSVLDLSMDALRDNGEARHALIRGLEIAESHIYIYTSLITNIIVAEGKERAPKKGTAASAIARNNTHEFIRQLGLNYVEWIAHVTDENADAKLLEWAEQVFSLTKEFGDEAVLNASQRSIAGRLEDSDKPDSHINAAKASNIFIGMLYKEKKGLANDK